MPETAAWTDAGYASTAPSTAALTAASSRALTGGRDTYSEIIFLVMGAHGILDVVTADPFHGICQRLLQEHLQCLRREYGQQVSHGALEDGGPQRGFLQFLLR